MTARHKRIVVIGGGTGGCAVAGRLARLAAAEVVLLEAGPDYGAFEDFAWPTELLDTRCTPDSHDWGLRNRDTVRQWDYPVSRAKVIGGCSSHNGCSAVRGTRSDFQRWARETEGQWRGDGLEADFREIETLLNVRTYALDEITPFQRHVRSAALAYGIPESLNINDLDEDEGVSVCPVNKRGSFRWNAAFAFLDPVRGRNGFSIRDRVEIDRLALSGERAVAACGRRAGEPFEIEADLFIVACGAYGSPILLQRSGIGRASDLDAAGIKINLESPGVGHNLQDHPSATLRYESDGKLIDEMEAHERARVPYEEGIIIKKRSPAAKGAFDLHIFSGGGRRAADRQQWYWEIFVCLMQEKSRGRAVVNPGSQGASFIISHDHFSDPAGVDLAIVTEGIEIARAIAKTPPLREMLKSEIEPGSGIAGPAEIAAWIWDSHGHYWHPTGSCRMGPQRMKGDVCDGQGRMHGLANVFIADASLMPSITSGNTNLPTALLGSRIGKSIADTIAD
jgi:choline dehydrogenase-like flavoprotein